MAKNRIHTDRFETSDAYKQKQKRQKTQMDWKLILTLSVVAIAVILLVWTYRLPQNYVNMYIGHYEGTSEMLDAVKTLQHTDEEKLALNPLQEAYDDFAQQNIAHEIETEGYLGATIVSDVYDQGSDVTVIMLHSFDGSKKADQLLAPFFYEKGYNIVIPDLRDHGESTGDYVTWGLYESQDLLALTDAVLERFGTDSQIILYGNLLGAGTELMAQKDLPSNVKFMIAEDAYNNLHDLGSHYFSANIHMPAFAAMPLMNFFSNRLYEFNDTAVDVAAAVDGSIPTLLVYGTQDQLITSDMQQALADALGDSAEVLMIENGRYGTNYAMGQESYEQKIESFIETYLD